MVEYLVGARMCRTRPCRCCTSLYYSFGRKDVSATCLRHVMRKCKPESPEVGNVLSQQVCLAYLMIA